MTEAASAPVAAPSTPNVPAPNSAFTPKAPQSAPQAPAASTPAPTPNGQADGQPEPLTKAERIELSKLPPTARVVLNIDGEEREMSAADAYKLLSRNGSANKRYQEAAEQRRLHAQEKAEFEKYQQEFAGALSDPSKLRRELAELGLSPREIAQALLRIEEQEAALSPAERKLREYEEREKARQAEDQAAEARAFEEQTATFREAYQAAYNGVMDECNVPKNHFTRDMLTATLAQATQFIQSTEGRMITKAEAKRVVQNAIESFGGLRQPTPEDRLAAITDADYEAYAKRKREARPQAQPPVGRDPNSGRFVPQNGAQGQEQGGQRANVNVNGETIVNRLSDRWGGRM